MSDFYKVFLQFDRWKLYLEGLKNSLLIAFFGFVISFFLGLFVAVLLFYLKSSKKFKWLYFLLNSVTSLLRAVPLLLQILIGYFVVFAFMKNAVIVAIIVFGINSSAYMCEIIRGGINSVSPSQIEAGKSLGVSNFKIITKIILPQALRNCLPSISNECITVLKMTSLTGWISIVDLTQAANIISTNTFIYLLPLGIVAIVYIIFVATINLIFHLIEKRLKKYN